MKEAPTIIVNSYYSRSLFRKLKKKIKTIDKVTHVDITCIRE